MKGLETTHAAHRRPGFTLVELIVTIVIVVILAAIGFSITTKVRKKARSMQCMTRMRDWTTVFTASSLDLAGGRMHCPQNWASIGSGTGGYPSSPFLLYWAEAVGLSGDSRRNLSDFSQEEVGLIREYQQKVRSCPCLVVGKSASGNAGTSYMFNRNLANAHSTVGGIRIDVINPNKVRRVSKKIYFIDGRATGPLNIPSKTEALSGVREAQDAHGGKVTAVFLDMHIERISADELENDWQVLVTP